MSSTDNYTGVWIRFSRHSSKWRLARNFHSPCQKTGPIDRNRRREEKKNSPGLRVSLYLYSPGLNSTRIWRVGDWLSATLTDVLGQDFTAYLQKPLIFLLPHYRGGRFIQVTENSALILSQPGWL
jgi:hypothetical protein